MGATPFRTMDWAPHEVVTKTKLDQMQANQQWLRDNTARAQVFEEDGGHKDESVVIVAGRASIIRNKYSYVGSANVYFPAVFSPTTIPNITTSVVSFQKKQVFCTVNGLGGTYWPDYRGFTVYIYITTLSARPVRVRGKLQRDTPDYPIFVHWHATGVGR